MNPLVIIPAYNEEALLPETLAGLPAIKAKLTARSSTLIQRLEGELDLCAEVRAGLERALMEDCPLVSRDGGFIREGFSSELDALRDLTGEVKVPVDLAAKARVPIERMVAIGPRKD